ERGQPKTIADYKLVLFGSGLTLIFGLLLAWQKHFYDERDRSREQRYSRQQEIRKDVIPKLEALRLPLSNVAAASEASSLGEYENSLSAAVQESDAAIASLSEGYDPL